MTLKEVYQPKDNPKPYDGITESKFISIDCDRCGESTVRVNSRQRYCSDCGPEVHREQNRKLSKKPEYLRKQRIRNKRRFSAHRGEDEKAEEIVSFISQEPTRAAKDLEAQMLAVSSKAVGDLVLFTFGRSRIPVYFSKGDAFKSLPHFHIRQGSAEFSFNAQDAGEIYRYTDVRKALAKAAKAQLKK